MIDVLDDLQPLWWYAAIVCFVVGDLLITFVGLTLLTIVEDRPVATWLIDSDGFGPVSPAKLGVLSVLYGLSRVVPRPHRTESPLATLVGLRVPTVMAGYRIATRTGRPGIALNHQNWYSGVTQTTVYEQSSRGIEVVEVNRRQADTVAGGAVVTVLIVGGVLGWQAYQRQQAFDQMGSMMGMSMGTVHGTSPFWYVLGALLCSAVIAAGYFITRDELSSTPVPDHSETTGAPHVDSESLESPKSDTQTPGGINPESRPQARVLDLLPEDERQILEPVISSPGVTQIELRDRSEFSKSKVSQTVSALEKRGLLYRERQGRTYRIYPSDDLQQEHVD